MLSREFTGVTTVVQMDQVQGQTSNEPRDYEWAEFNLPAELRDGDAGSQQQAAPAAQADVDH